MTEEHGEVVLPENVTPKVERVLPLLRAVMMYMGLKIDKLKVNSKIIREVAPYFLRILNVGCFLGYIVPHVNILFEFTLNCHHH